MKRWLALLFMLLGAAPLAPCCASESRDGGRQSCNRYVYCLNNPLLYTDPELRGVVDTVADAELDA